MSDTPLYTIGYGARDIDAFLAALGRYHVAYLIDVRSRPYSRYKPEFSREPLEEQLRGAGIRYVFMGDSLGGRPDDSTCYDSDGKVDYAQVAERDFFHAGLARLADAHQKGLVVALMCSEGKPENCHRSKLIGKALTQRGLPVAHIDENDALIDQEGVLLRHTGGQRTLFGDAMLPGNSRKRYRSQEEEEVE
jgi:uncharacterized protein (DUF488 family)